MSLITKLDSNVTDSSLPQLGAIRIKSKAVESPNGNNRIFSIYGDWSAKIVGDPSTCYFTDSTLTQNNGQEISFTGSSAHYAWVSNANCEIIVKPKYGILGFTMNSEGVYFDDTSFDDIGVIPGCTFFGFFSSSTSGDVTKLKGLASLKNISQTVIGADYYNVKGDLEELANLPLETITLPKTDVHVSLSVLAQMNTLKSVNLYSCENVEGSVNDFADCDQYTFFRIGGMRSGANTKITGDITSLGKMINATNIEVAYTSVIGTCDDLAAALALNGKTSGSVTIRDKSGTQKSFTFPLA